MSPNQERTRIWHHAGLGLELFQAYYVEHAFPRHSHDYYVICLVKRGLQSFTHRGTKYYTPAGGLILINPGAAHTGEVAGEMGFEMLCLYPTGAHLQNAVFELTGRQQSQPFFREVRVDQPWAAKSISGLHRSLTGEGTDPLESESRFTWVLAQLVRHYAEPRFDEQPAGRERRAVQQARGYIEACFAEGLSLSQLAGHVGLSPYHLLRVFRAELGMPPYAYLESVRIRQAQRLIAGGKSLAQVAAEVGFSSQSHLTNRFKQIIGVTPGQYAQELRKL